MILTCPSSFGSRTQGLYRRRQKLCSCLSAYLPKDLLAVTETASNHTLSVSTIDSHVRDANSCYLTDAVLEADSVLLQTGQGWGGYEQETKVGWLYGVTFRALLPSGIYE